MAIFTGLFAIAELAVGFIGALGGIGTFAAPETFIEGENDERA
jgi:hypothetical protein